MKLESCTNLDQLKTFVDGMKLTFRKNGGRRFSVDGKDNYALKDVIKRFNDLQNVHAHKFNPFEAPVPYIIDYRRNALSKKFAISENNPELITNLNRGL